jgi:hypothetical protein
MPFATGAASAEQSPVDAVAVGVTVVGEAHDTAVEVTAAPGQVVLEVAITPRDSAASLDVAASVELVAGSGIFVPLTPAGSGSGIIATTSPIDADGAVHRVRVTPLSLGDVDVAVTARDTSTSEPRFVVHDSITVSSRFDVVSVIDAAAEIVTVTTDGTTLIATGSGGLNFVDIADPAHPGPVENLQLSMGRPTSVDMTPDGRYALASGTGAAVVVVDLATRQEVRAIPVPIGGDSIDVSPNGRYAAIALEAESSGQGGVEILDLLPATDPAAWSARTVSFNPNDPALEDTDDDNIQPEFVTIEPTSTKVAVTLQENNAIAIIDLATGAIDRTFTAGYETRDFDLHNDGRISFTEPASLAREPDGIVWFGDRLFTADEGETRGSRGVSVFSASTGELLWDSGLELEQDLAHNGLYNDTRSDIQGPEYEGAAGATYPATGESFAFAGAERADAVSIYRMDEPSAPMLAQQVGVGMRSKAARPEGLLPIPARDLLVVANENDETIVVLQRHSTAVTPAIGRPIRSQFASFSLLAGLSAAGDGRLVTVDTLSPATVYALTPGVSEYTIDTAATVTEHGAPLDAVLTAGTSDGADGYWVVTAEPRLLHLDASGAVTESVDLPVYGTFGSVLTGITRSDDGATVYVSGNDNDGLASIVPLLAIDTATLALESRRVDIAGDVGITQLGTLPGGDLVAVAPATFSEEPPRVYRLPVDGVPAGGVVTGLLVGRIPTGGAYAVNGVVPAGDDLLVLRMSGAGTQLISEVADALLVTGPAPAITLESVAPVTTEAGVPFPVDFTTNRQGTVRVEVRAAGDSAASWTSLGTIDVDAAGTFNDYGNAVPRLADGAYDLRVVLLDALGRTAISQPLLGGLVVDTGATDLIFYAPTESAPQLAKPGGAFQIEFRSSRGGPFEVLAKPSGAPDADFAPLQLRVDQPYLADRANFTLRAVAPATLGAYDLRLRVLAGGDTEATLDSPAALQVVDLPAPTVTIDSPTSAAPVTVFGADQLTVAVTSDQGGSYRVATRRNGDSVWTVQAGEDGVAAGTYLPQIQAPLIDGAWDIRVTFTNEVGETTVVTEPAAFSTSTPAPTVSILSPTAASPLAADGAGLIDISLRVNEPGTADIDFRPSGTTEWATVGYDQDREIGAPGDVTVFNNLFGVFATGSYDLRVTFTNRAGVAVEAIELGVLQVTQPAAVVTVTSPAEGATLTKPVGGKVAVTFQSDQPVVSSVELKPAGDPDSAYAAVGSLPSAFSGTIVATLPATTGTYDLRLVARNASGHPTTIERPGLVVLVLPPQPGVVIAEYAARGPAGGTDEFVELANTGAAAVDISGWTVLVCPGAGAAPRVQATVPAGIVLAARDRFLIASAGYPGIAGDAQSPLADLLFSSSSQLGNFDGVQLLRADGSVVDGLGLANAGGALCGEGERPSTTGSSAATSLQRDLHATDMNDNLSDATWAPRNPQARGSLVPPADVPEVPVVILFGASAGAVVLLVTRRRRRSATV